MKLRTSLLAVCLTISGIGAVAHAGAVLRTTADFEGFALISEEYDGEEKLIQRSTFEPADEAYIPDEEFDPPSGYKRQTLEELRR